MTNLISNLFVNKICQLTCCRTISTANVLSKQDSRFMTKVMRGPKNKKKWQNPDSGFPVIPTATNLAQGATEGNRSANTKRVAVLNKLFMRSITDLMATGENASVFLGKGLEINRVAVTPDFKGVNVFWIAKGTEDDEKLESLLSQHAGALRHELSQLRVMGVVPKINFVKDKEYAKLMEVDLRLSRADFGQDYISVEPSYKFRSEFSLNTPLPTHLKEKIEELESEDTIEEIEEPLPEMRMDVLGLNHAEIMAKVKKSMKKSQALHRKNKEISEELKLSTTVNEDPVEYRSQKQQREAFQQFLLKRQILRAKAKKEKDKSYPEYEYMRAENEILPDTPFLNELKETDIDYLEEQEDKDNKLHKEK